MFPCSSATAASPDQSWVVPAVLLSTGQACQAAQHDPRDSSGTTTSHTLPSRLWLCFHVYALKFSWCCPIFPFPSPPTVSLPAHTLTEHVQAGFIWMGQSTSLKMPSEVELYVVHERKSMWIRQEICSLAFALPRCLTPGQPCLSCPLPDWPCR